MNRAVIGLALLVASMSGACRAGASRHDCAAESQPAATTQDGHDQELTVAILDFESSVPADPKLGEQVGQALSAALTDEPGFALVDRSDLSRILHEHELTLAGLIDSKDAAKVGKLASARILITGKVDLSDGELNFYAKIIGTETSLFNGVLVTGEKDSRPGPLIKQLTQQVVQKLRRGAAKLVGADHVWQDPLPKLARQLDGLQKPKLAVAFSETHIGQPAGAPPDPAAATEIRLLLDKAGLSVIEGNEKELTAADVRYQITGEAFSEPGAHIASLISCPARVEIKVVDRKTGEVIYSDRQTSRAVDLAEHVAGKSAIQKASHLLGIRLLEKLTQLLPPKGQQPPKPQ